MTFLIMRIFPLPSVFSLLKYLRSIRNVFVSHPPWRKKSLSTPSSRGEWVTQQTANLGTDRLNPGIRILPLQVPTTFSEGIWAGRGQGNFLSFGWEISLKADEPQICQRHDVKRKREYFSITIFSERTWNFTSIKKRTNEHHSDGKLQLHSLP